MVDGLIGFGSNQGDSVSIYQQVCTLLDSHSTISVAAASKLLTTSPIGGPAGQRAYSNGALRVKTTLPASELHLCLMRLETDLGRQRKIRWASRIVDLDLLIYGDHRVELDSLLVPHPRMSFRRFVLEPALEIAADMLHVDSGLTIAQLVHHLNATPNVVKILTDSQDKFEQLVSRNPDWQFHFDESELGSAISASNAKLVVDTRSKSNTDILSWRPKAPHLVLTDVPSENMTLEIEAAIEAMNPLATPD